MRKKTNGFFYKTVSFIMAFLLLFAVMPSAALATSEGVDVPVGTGEQTDGTSGQTDETSNAGEGNSGAEQTAGSDPVSSDSPPPESSETPQPQPSATATETVTPSPTPEQAQASASAQPTATAGEAQQNIQAVQGIVPLGWTKFDELKQALADPSVTFIEIDNDMIFTSAVTIAVNGTEKRTITLKNTAAGFPVRMIVPQGYDFRHFNIIGNVELIFEGEVSMEGSLSGGGINVLAGGNLELRGGTISHCIAGGASRGGAVNVAAGAQMTVDGTLFSGNDAGVIGMGGSIYNDGALIVSNTTFDGNLATAGGAVYGTGVACPPILEPVPKLVE